jgi:hypothetical protein
MKLSTPSYMILSPSWTTSRASGVQRACCAQNHEWIIACSIQVQQPEQTPPTARDPCSPHRLRKDLQRPRRHWLRIRRLGFESLPALPARPVKAFSSSPRGPRAAGGNPGLGAGGGKPIAQLARRASDSDGDLSVGAAIFQVAYGLGDFGQRIGLAHDGCDATGLDLLTQCFEVGLAVRGDVHGQPLRNHRRERERTDLPPDSGPLAALAASDHEGALGGECPPQPREGAVSADVENQVIVLAAVGEVLPGVVDDPSWLI